MPSAWPSSRRTSPAAGADLDLDRSWAATRITKTTAKQRAAAQKQGAAARLNRVVRVARLDKRACMTELLSWWSRSLQTQCRNFGKPCCLQGRLAHRLTGYNSLP